MTNKIWQNSERHHGLSERLAPPAYHMRPRGAHFFRPKARPKASKKPAPAAPATGVLVARPWFSLGQRPPLGCTGKAFTLQ